MTKTIISVPNCLRWEPQAAEELVSLAVENIEESPLVFDMHQVEFVNPYGALLLMATSRHVTDTTGHKVKLENLDSKIGAYLERMDFFSEGDEWLYTEDEPTEKLSRSSASSNLLEITRLTSISARTQFQDRTRRVLSAGLPSKQQEINEIVTVLSEICGNAEEHSQDQGHVMVQSYHYQAYTEVDIVVMDLGIGIHGSLSNQYQHLARTDLDYIRLALSGHSSRGKQMGGAGLQIVQKHVVSRSGELAIRSGNGLMVINHKGDQRSFNTHMFPGTQVSLKLRG